MSVFISLCDGCGRERGSCLGGRFDVGEYTTSFLCSTCKKRMWKVIGGEIEAIRRESNVTAEDMPTQQSMFRRWSRLFAD